jgi:aminoglycoside 3-N-acetyltransferase
MIAEILARAPALEVAARLAYWRLPIAKAAGDALLARRAARRRSVPQPPAGEISIDAVTNAIRDMGVGEGDILVVHSSYDRLKPTGLTAAEINGALKAIVGDSGTLAMPAIPIIRHEPKGAAKFDPASYDRVFDFDVRSRRIATGELPKALMMDPAARRSRHPGNSMVAVGPEAAAMMEHNLDEPEPTPCGRGSSWEYCYRRNAAVVALGIDLVHSLTMIHVAEDTRDAWWPVRDWYRRRRFRITDGEFELETTIREREHGWSQFIPQRAISRDFYRNAIADTRTVDTLEVHSCRSGSLIEYVIRHPNATYPYLFPFGFRARGGPA